ncbi:MAG TPA: DNA repair protein RecO [Aestuariivirgaceae bacterium]|jgi:DNA repair protein RecO (recombination protein O)
MLWSEEAIVLAVRRHGETSAIVEALTRGRGRSLGLVRGGRSRALRPVLQPGNSVIATWRARLEDHLGLFTVEMTSPRAAQLMDDPFKLAGLTTVTALAQLLPEREPHPRIYDATKVLLDRLEDDAIWPALLARWELGLLDELGFGLDLARCAATGSNEALAYVSPKTGRAVGAEAGEPYRDRLLKLPQFLSEAKGIPDRSDVVDGLKLTGYFLERHILGPRGLPSPGARQSVLERLARDNP